MLAGGHEKLLVGRVPSYSRSKKYVPYVIHVEANMPKFESNALEQQDLFSIIQHDVIVYRTIGARARWQPPR